MRDPLPVIKRMSVPSEGQPGSNVHFQGTRVDQGRNGEVVESEAEVAGNGAFVGGLAAGLAGGDEFSEVGVDGRDVLEVAEVTVVVELGHVVGGEFIGLVKSSRIDRKSVV